MAQEQKEQEVSVYLTLDGKKLSPTSHIPLKAWDASDVVLAAANSFIECIFEITQRRFHLVPESNWLRNESMHSKKSNDGSRCRVPIIFGPSSQMFDRLKFKYDHQNKAQQNIIKKIKYESSVYIPGVDDNPIQLVDHALIIVANDANIQKLTKQITDNITKYFADIQKTISDDTKEIALSLEKCLNI